MVNHRLQRLVSSAIALVALCFAPVRGWAADETAISNAVDAAIRPLMAEHKVPGMAVAVTVDGHAYFFNYGVASRESNVPVNETTLFELGSVSKTFTATLAMYAQGTHKLSLADHPGKYIPQLKGTAIDQATLLHLGTYTAGGLPLQFPDEVTDDAGALTYIQAWKPEAAPGIDREYSNPSLGLFGYATAQALHRDFTGAVQTVLLPRLGLEHTYVRVPDGAMADYAWGYDEDKPVRVSPGAFDVETYGIKSSSADMIRFVQANIDPSRLDQPMRRAITATHVAYFKLGAMAQGLGWEQYAYPVSQADLLAGNSAQVITQANAVEPFKKSPKGPRLFNKTGSTRGFGAYVAFVPEKRIGVVLLANRNYPIAARVQAAYAVLTSLSEGDAHLRGANE